MDARALVSAGLVAGATAAQKTDVDPSLIARYEALKTLVRRRWDFVEVELLERNPASEARRAVLDEDLSRADGLDDRVVLDQASAVLQAVKKHDPDAVALGGIDIGLGKTDVHITFETGEVPNSTSVGPYLISRGPALYQELLNNQTAGRWDPEILCEETIANLRAKLLFVRKRPKPQPITVTGTLFPCALLSSGWWDKNQDRPVMEFKWRDEVQKWLFHGFDEWGPSWDFSWDFESPEKSKNRKYFIAQLGEGDEANSLPVLIPAAKASPLQEHVAEQGRWGGIDAKVTGILEHRDDIAPDERELFGGFLDYCLRVEDHPRQGVVPLRPAAFYSGYLWRCVAPEAWLTEETPSLRDVYFVWEHTNFASKDAVAYALDALNRKDEFLQKRFGKLKLVQKSSALIPGTPAWPQQDIYRMLFKESSGV